MQHDARRWRHRELKGQVAASVCHYNHASYRESVGNVTLVDLYPDCASEILAKHEKIKHMTIANCCLQRLRRKGSVVSDQIPLPASAWSSLSILNRTRSLVRERTAPKETIHDVRIFPRLKSPFRADTVNALSGMSLARAFRRFVFGDPEVAKLGKAARAVAPGFAALLSDWQCFLDCADR